MKPDVKCPAGEEANPAFSPNPMDVRCRVSGGLRPAQDRTKGRRVSGEPVVCCAEYARCRIWQVHKDIVRPSAPSTADQRRVTIGKPHTGVMADASRDRIVV